MSRKMRKPRPSPPKWYWLDSDNCWFCKNKNNCGNCKILKELAASIKHKKELKLKQNNYLDT